MCTGCRSPCEAECWFAISLAKASRSTGSGRLQSWPRFRVFIGFRPVTWCAAGAASAADALGLLGCAGGAWWPSASVSNTKSAPVWPMTARYWPPSMSTGPAWTNDLFESSQLPGLVKVRLMRLQEHETGHRAHQSNLMYYATPKWSFMRHGPTTQLHGVSAGPNRAVVATCRAQAHAVHRQVALVGGREVVRDIEVGGGGERRVGRQAQHAVAKVGGAVEGAAACTKASAPSR